MKKKVFSLILAVIMIMSLSACGNSDNNGGGGIYATIAPVYDFTKKIAGDKQMVGLMIAGDAHDYEPSASDMAKFQKASMIVTNGMGLDLFVDKMDTGSIKVINTSKDTIKADYGELEQGHFIDDGHGHDNTELDPHIWLYPVNAKKQMESIKEALCEMDIANAAYYESNYDIAAKKCDELDTKLKGLKGKKIVTSHNAYNYLEKMYGIDVMSMDAGGEKEVSPAKMKEMVEYCKANNIKVIYCETGSNDKNAAALAQSIGGSVVEINSYESVVGGNDDYFKIMEENYEALVKY